MSKAMKAVLAAVPTESELQQLVFAEIQSAAGPVAAANQMPHLIPVDTGLIGDLPWFHQLGTNTNDKTYNWLNNVFASSGDGYVGTRGEALTTEYANVLEVIEYTLDSADGDALNAANLAAATIANTVISDWTTTMGAFPSATPSTLNGQLGYIMSQMLTWGAPGLTSAQFSSSRNPSALLNIPPGAEQIVSDYLSYLSQTNSVTAIRNAVYDFNVQNKAAHDNTAPLTPPTTDGPTYMKTVDDKGNVTIVPRIDIAESNATIQSALIVPSGSGTSISTTFTASAVDTDTVHITTVSGGGASGGLGFFLSVGGHTTTTTDIFSFAENQSSCQVTLTFNGVTTFTPAPAAYNVTTGAGWWNPEPIEEAANPVPNQSGYIFSAKPQLDFGVNGDFGVIQRLLISQQPIIELTYTTSDFASFKKTVKSHTDWSVSFLGMSLAGGSSDYYHAETSQNASAGTVTLTMSPARINTPVTPSDQLAYVIGAQILWPGASALQNKAGI